MKIQNKLADTRLIIKTNYEEAKLEPGAIATFRDDTEELTINEML